MDDNDEQRAEHIARIGNRLAAAGFVPFAVLSVWLVGIAPDHPSHGFTLLLLTGYGAVILSFLGGARWGFEIHRHGEASGRTLAVSMIPALVAFAAFAVPAPYVFAMLAVAFAAQGAWDSFSAHSGKVSQWYGRMRIILTVLVCAALIVAFMATAY